MNTGCTTTLPLSLSETNPVTGSNTIGKLGNEGALVGQNEQPVTNPLNSETSARLSMSQSYGTAKKPTGPSTSSIALAQKTEKTGSEKANSAKQEEIEKGVKLLREGKYGDFQNWKKNNGFLFESISKRFCLLGNPFETKDRIVLSPAAFVELGKLGATIKHNPNYGLALLKTENGDYPKFKRWLNEGSNKEKFSKIAGRFCLKESPFKTENGIGLSPEAFVALGNLEPRIKDNTDYGLALLKTENGDYPKFKSWLNEGSNKNKEKFSKIAGRLCLPGNPFEIKNGIELSPEAFVELGNLEPRIKDNTDYGLALLKTENGDYPKFKSWLNEGSNKNKEKFSKIAGRLCLPGNPFDTANGIELSPEAFVALGNLKELGSNITKKLDYGLALLNAAANGDCSAFKSWLNEESNKEKFNKIADRLCLPGNPFDTTNGIELSQEAFVELGNLKELGSNITNKLDYGLALLNAAANGDCSVFKNWAQEKSDSFKTLADRFYLKESSFKIKDGIELTPEEFKKLGDLEEIGDTIKTNPNYGLMLFKTAKMNDYSKFKSWLNEGSNKDSFKTISSKLYLQGTSNIENGIELTPEEFIALGELEPRIKDNPNYGLALLKEGLNKGISHTTDFKKWLKSGGHRDSLKNISSKLYLQGTSNNIENGIELTTFEFRLLGVFEPSIKDNSNYGLALFKAGGSKDFNTWLGEKESNTNTTHGETLLNRLCLIKNLDPDNEELIELSPNDFVALGKLDEQITTLPHYEAAQSLEKAGVTGKVDLPDLRNRIYLEGEKKPLNGIKVSADVYDQINRLTFDEVSNLLNGNDLEMIGSGSFGEVYKVQKGNKTYCIKVGKPNASEEDFDKEKDQLENLWNQINALPEPDRSEARKLFPKYYGAFKINGKFVFVTEFVKGGDLDNKIHKEQNLTLEEKIELGQQMCKAVAILTKLGINHRDIKPENFLFDEGNFQVKCADFGLSCFNCDQTKGIGSPAYMSPEVLNKQLYGFSCDVFALGISLLELFIGDSPYPKSEFRFPWMISQHVVQGNVYGHIEKMMQNNFEGNEEEGKFLIKLIQDCTVSKPQERISAEQAAYLLQKFFEGKEAGEIPEYEKLKTESVYPKKKIPKTIEDKIINESTKEAGLVDLSQIVAKDPSYIDTTSYGLILLKTNEAYFKDWVQYEASKETLNDLEDLISDNENYKNIFQKAKNGPENIDTAEYGFSLLKTKEAHFRLWVQHKASAEALKELEILISQERNEENKEKYNKIFQEAKDGVPEEKKTNRHFSYKEPIENSWGEANPTIKDIRFLESIAPLNKASIKKINDCPRLTSKLLEENCLIASFYDAFSKDKKTYETIFAELSDVQELDPKPEVINNPLYGVLMMRQQDKTIGANHFTDWANNHNGACEELCGRIQLGNLSEVKRNTIFLTKDKIKTLISQLEKTSLDDKTKSKWIGQLKAALKGSTNQAESETQPTDTMDSTEQDSARQAVMAKPNSNITPSPNEKSPTGAQSQTPTAEKQQGQKLYATQTGNTSQGSALNPPNSPNALASTGQDLVNTMGNGNTQTMQEQDSARKAVMTELLNNPSYLEQQAKYK